jgi:3-hydroxyacyl-CoA dehydrogenase
VRDLSRAELTGYLNLVSFFKELAGLARLKSQIVLRNTRADLDPLDVLLLLFGLALPMLLLILVLAEVNDSANRGLGRRGHHHQIEAVLARLVQRLAGLKNAELLTVRTDHAHVAETKAALVDQRTRVWARVSPKSSYVLSPLAAAWESAATYALYLGSIWKPRQGRRPQSLFDDGRARDVCRRSRQVCSPPESGSFAALFTQGGCLHLSVYDGWGQAQSVCVVGAGTMGGGIAAHLANLGFDVTLLDLTLESARDGLERTRSARPPHYYLPETSERIRLGSIRDNLAWASEADWVCEAIIENLQAKRELFRGLDEAIRPDAMLTTNTSGLEINLLAEERSESFRRRFLGTHFFNPPRYLKLLELIPTAETDPEAVAAMSAFLENRVARRVVLAKDTPGFIANRFGMWAMYHAIHVAERLQLTVEQVDAITGPFLGRPKSASFRLNDLVGLDIMRDIAENLVRRCTQDPYLKNFEPPRSFTTLLSRGWIGDKAGQGYYKKEGKELVSFDFRTLAYRQRQEPHFDSLAALSKLPTGERIAQALELKDEVGEFLRMHLLPVLRYAYYLREEISHSVQDFDRVMKWGFGWELGPFETIDAIGSDRAEIPEGPFYRDGEMRSFAGIYVPLKEEREYAALADFQIVEEADDFRIRDLGDGVVALCLKTKMGTINPSLVVELLERLENGKLGRFVLTSEARMFSAGYDLRYFLERIDAEDFEAVDTALASLQRLTLRLGEVPSVAAVFGHCLGAGQELAMGCARTVALAEAQIGLPDSKVGVLPGGGGSALMRLRAQFGGAKRLAEVARRVAAGAVAKNALEAQEWSLLRESDWVVFHPDRLLHEARRVALEVEPTPLPSWLRPEGPVAGMIDRLLDQAVEKGEMTDHDEAIGMSVKNIFAKASSLEDALAKERSEFIELCQKALTVTRMRHMVETGKPLRN